MLGDTFVLPHPDGNVTMTKINQDGYSAEYLFRASTYEYRATVRHSRTKATSSRVSMDRHNVEIVKTTYAAGEVAQFDQKVYIVLENLPSDADIYKIVDGLCDWLIASTDANTVKLMGWES